MIAILMQRSRWRCNKDEISKSSFSWDVSQDLFVSDDYLNDFEIRIIRRVDIDVGKRDEIVGKSKKLSSCLSNVVRCTEI